MFLIQTETATDAHCLRNDLEMIDDSNLRKYCGIHVIIGKYNEQYGRLNAKIKKMVSLRPENAVVIIILWGKVGNGDQLKRNYRLADFYIYVSGNGAKRHLLFSPSFYNDEAWRHLLMLNQGNECGVMGLFGLRGRNIVNSFQCTLCSNWHCISVMNDRDSRYSNFLTDRGHSVMVFRKEGLNRVRTEFYNLRKIE